MEKIVNNVQEICEELGVPDFEALKKAIYKGTACGAWITASDRGVQVGSIVEGSDAETETYTLNFPFEYRELWSALDCVDKEAAVLWEEANGEPTNEERAEAARAALESQEKYHDGWVDTGDPEDGLRESIADLMTDLLHLARLSNYEIDGIMALVQMHFDAEIEEVDAEFFAGATEKAHEG